MSEMNILAYDHDEERLGFGEPHRAGKPPVPPLARAGTAAGVLGLLALGAALFGAPLSGTWLGLIASFGLIAVGAATTFVARSLAALPGIRHDGLAFRGLTSRGLPGWILGLVITGFYVLLYFRPETLARAVRLVDPLATAITGKSADQWFLYGFLYTTAVLVFGIRMLVKYRHNRYQMIRTGSVIFFQLAFSFLIPGILKALNQPEFYFTYFWPLKYDYLFPATVHDLLSHPGGLGTFMVFWGAALTLIATPVLTYFFGKRWYCSWVCGCGGLAETLGDPFRQLSNKKPGAWRIERLSIHAVLVAITLLTALLWIDGASAGGFLGSFSDGFRRTYGFIIGALFSGVIGVGFYPILGNRVWCRFGCPMAAVLGIFQRVFSRFRITTNGGQCMSCGNCSTYCEMGIDVRAYAQKRENIVRASCVGCGVCAAVCPRGVLKLENGASHKDRYPGAQNPFRAFVDSFRTPEIYDSSPPS